MSDAPKHSSPSYKPATCCPTKKDCVHGDDSTAEEPCWGPVDIECQKTEDGDVVVHVCEGHMHRVTWYNGGKYIKEKV